MPKRHEYQRRNNNQGGYSNQRQNNSQERGSFRENNQSNQSNQSKNFHRDNNAPRQNFSNQNSPPRYINRIRAEETVEDIRRDISRIEKEIELEIKEIKSLRMGL